jgi:D-alanyl-lipoteichoic acid acyltransferase DltB (MBOAT superfamily)
MIFNSYLFLLVFLPLVLIGFTLLVRLNSGTAAIGFLSLASLVFYSAWNPVYLPLLLLSIGLNYLHGRLILPCNGRWRTALLCSGITFNLGLLAYFKYANFFLATATDLGGGNFQPLDVVLPLAISFFSFQQIAFLVDTYRGLCEERSFGRYLLFVAFFPQLIAGPIVHHKEMMPQFKLAVMMQGREIKMTHGVIFLVLGLAKKVLIADSLAPYAIDVFDQQESVSFADAWLGTLAYTLQLYFDFSGYTDMAIGIALLFGIRLPDNFDSPYQARSIVDFWRRWHMTLSRFLRDYLYIPLGGNRRGRGRRYVNLTLTMLLGGLWHGAAWTFVIWGAMHGLLLVVNHGWHYVQRRTGLTSLAESFTYRAFCWALTLLAVMHCWVMFRAPSLDRAMKIYTAMYSPGDRAGELAFPQQVPYALLVLATLVALYLPNIKRMLGAFEAYPNWPGLRSGASAAGRAAALALACLAVYVVTMLDSFSEFLYFQF